MELNDLHAPRSPHLDVASQFITQLDNLSDLAHINVEAFDLGTQFDHHINVFSVLLLSGVQTKGTSFCLATLFLVDKLADRTVILRWQSKSNVLIVLHLTLDEMDLMIQMVHGEVLRLYGPCEDDDELTSIDWVR